MDLRERLAGRVEALLSRAEALTQALRVWSWSGVACDLVVASDDGRHRVSRSVAETVSVVIQVGSFKLRGKRIFRMAPLHNQFQWPEVKVTIRFWLIGAVAGIVAAILAFATPIR